VGDQQEVGQECEGVRRKLDMSVRRLAGSGVVV